MINYKIFEIVFVSVMALVMAMMYIGYRDKYSDEKDKQNCAIGIVLCFLGIVAVLLKHFGLI